MTALGWGARMDVVDGPLARPLVGRFVCALAARSNLGIDRVDEAGLLVETLTDRASDLCPGDRHHVRATVHEDHLDLRFGPLPPGIGARLLAAHPGGGADTVRGLATSASVQRSRSGTEHVRARIA